MRHEPEELRGDPRDGRLLRGERFGQLCHAVIAELARLDRPARTQVIAAVSRTLARQGTANPALRRRLTATAMTYATEFAPRGARFVGAELDVAGQRMDLVWRIGRVVWADELKSAGAGLTAAIAEQCERQLRAGHSHWGDAFVGVRVIWLATPGRELMVGYGERMR